MKAGQDTGSDRTMRHQSDGRELEGIGTRMDSIYTPEHARKKTGASESRFYSARFAGHSLSVSRANPKESERLAFGHLLSTKLQAQALAYTPSSEGCGGERRELLDRMPASSRRQPDRANTSKMPAVLLEASIIVNGAEELLLETPERSRIAQAMLATVSRLCR